jgi:DNA-binding NarL/FixJ family response regulator
MMMQQSKVEPITPQQVRVRPKTLGLVWVKCPYPMVAFGLKQVLKVAGYDVYCGQKPEVQKSPSSVIYCPKEEDDVGLEIKSLRDQVPDAPVLVLASDDDLPLAQTALKAGADGVIHARMQPEQIVRTLEAAIEGEAVISGELLKVLVSEGEPFEDISALGRRKLEILGLVAEGLTNAQIAKRLFLSESTVKQHLRFAYKVLGVKNRTKAAQLLRQST